MSFNYGGQALVEGVMIRAERGVAVAVRDPDGHIVTHTEHLEGGLLRSPLGRLPFIRGVFALWETLTIGTRMLLFSANVAAGKGADESLPAEARGAAAGAVIFAVGFFFVLPIVALQRAGRRVQNPLGANLLEGAMRLGLFVGYIGLISRMENVRRVFAYHGAEHKTVHAHEHGVPLEPADVQVFPRAHPRCGTAFLLQLMVLSSVVFSLFGRPSLGRRILLRIIMVPVLSSLSYEWLRLGARHQDSPITRALIGPGLALQRLTTREPDDAQVETAIVAMREALALDAGDR